MKLLSINIGKEQAIQYANKSGTTGIYKNPTAGPVQITPEGLTDDAVIDRTSHAGPDQAVYAYGSADYDWWSTELGCPLAPGTFGENLTISDLESADLRIGDRLQVGMVTLEITAPRIPCSTLAARMVDPQFVKRFQHAEPPGLYCRVITPGSVTVGDPVTLQVYDGQPFTIIENFRLFYEKYPSETDLRRALAAPIAIRTRLETEERLTDLLQHL
jgi:MOSC domain-containing protein YiiM